jgi:cytochrome c peroxidase
MTIAVGDRLPEATFLEKGDKGIAPVTTGELFNRRTVALFAVPGAYTGVCSTQHLPSFIRVAEQLRAKGIDDIACVAVNDPHVTRAWGEATGALAAGIRMLADPASEFTRAMGLAYDNPGAGMYGRSRRYALLADDGAVSIFNLEASPGLCEVSAGEALLAAL